MFNVKEFVLENLINGVNKGIFAKEYASTLATNYFLKGILSAEDLQRFDEETKIEVVEEPIEELTEEVAEINVGDIEETVEENTENTADSAENTEEEAE